MARIDRVKLGLKERGIDPGRLRLSAICTVCTKPFLKEIAEMNSLLSAVQDTPQRSTGRRMTGRTEFDALVIGAGIAGLQAALDLADQGFTVAIVEQRRQASAGR